MKKLLAVALMAAVVLAGCKKDNDPVIKITKQPTAPAKLTEGEIPADTKLTVDATVTEGATLTYQWYEGDPGNKSSAIVRLIEGATSASYTIPTSLKEGVYNYFCEVGAQGAKAVRTSVVTVTVDKKPAPPAPVITIDTQPTAPEGKLTEGNIPADIKLTVAATVTQDATLTYQWYSYNPAVDGPVITLDGDVMANPWEKIDGATSASYTLPTDLKAGEYYYICDINAEGAEGKQTDPVKVTVAEKPVVIPPFATNPAAPKFAIPDMTVGTAITPLNVSGGVSGGKTPYTFSSNNLPAGLTIDASTGIILGVPTTPQAAGTATVTVTDSSNPAQMVTISVKYGKVSAAADDTPPPPPTYAIITALLMVDFDSAEEGYTAPAEKTVKILNVGTGAVTLTQPTSTKYTIGTLSTTELAAAGSSATFTIKPNEGLAVEQHNETITVRTSNGAEISFEAKFTVTPADELITVVTLTATTPVAGAPMLTDVTGADEAKYTAELVWIEANYTKPSPAVFGYYKRYYARITLTAKTGYTFGGLDDYSALTLNGITPEGSDFPLPVPNDTKKIDYLVPFPITASDLIFADNADYDIPAMTLGTAITNINVAPGASGGTMPYTFKATGLPTGITISEEGIISGTPTYSRDAGTATITVTDNNANTDIHGNVFPPQTKSIEINVGAVTAADPDADILTKKNFPDDNFRNALKTMALSSNWGYEDGKLTAAEAEAVTFIDVTNENITDLTGIEYFTGLTFLYCPDNKLTKLDVSKNTKLMTLNCYNNRITELELSNHTNLNYLFCHNNSLTKLDLSNNTNLSDLNCQDNFIAELDLPNYTHLMSLNCSNNQLTELDVSNNTQMNNLKCSSNFITELDLSNIIYLGSLYCSNNSLTELDLSNNIYLSTLDCDKNPGNGVDTFPVTVWAEFTIPPPDYFTSNDEWKYEGKTITPVYIKKQ